MWHPSLNRLFWVDIEGCRLHELDPKTQKAAEHPMPGMVSTLVPDRGDGMVITLKRGIYHYNPQQRRLKYLSEVEPAAANNRCNDGKCDPQGRLWFGTMSLDAASEAGNLYVYEAGGEPRLKLSRQTIPNGIAWSHDAQRMYYIDTITRAVTAYRYDALTAQIERIGKIIDVPADMGYPDGMCIDTESMLWIAHWGGFGVCRWNPDTGRLMEKISVPAPNAASCAFGGEGYRTLYITTARAGLSEAELEKYPLSGSLFACDTQAEGLAPYRFKI